MKYLFKTSIGFALLLFVTFGCEKIPDGLITPSIKNFQVTNLTAPDTFKFSSLDSTFGISIKLKGTIIPIQDPLGYLQNSKTRETLVPIKLLNSQQIDTAGVITAIVNGDVEMKQTFPSGKYNLVFQSIDSETQISTTIAIHQFFYNNSTENFPPEITDLKMYYSTELPTLRDTVERNNDVIFSIKATDANGLNDISKVSFNLFRPDRSNAGNFPMFDDGDAGHGDSVAGDGIYSLKNSFSSTSTIGTWNFIYSAVDIGDSISNVISHNLYIK